MKFAKRRKLRPYHYLMDYIRRNQGKVAKFIADNAALITRMKDMK